MSLPRFLFSALRNRPTETLNQLKRFGQTKIFHCSSYKRAPTQPLVVTEKTQTSQSWRRYIVPTAVLGGFGGLAALFHYNDERRAIAKGQEVKCEASTCEGPRIGGPFSLFDTKGHSVTEGNLRGNWILLYFGYTLSPDIGPAEVQKMAKAVNTIEESKENLKVLPVFVTIDPQRDNPSQLRAYLKEFDSRIVGLTGPVSAIRQMAQEYRVFFKKIEEDGDDYLVESSDNMYLMNPSLETVRCFGVEYNADQLSEAMLKELKKT